MEHSNVFPERRLQVLREMITTVSLVLSVLCCLFFMLAMHFIVVIVAPAAIRSTAPTLIVSIISVAVGIASSLPTTHQKRIFGISVMFTMLYFVISLSVSFSSTYPGLYTSLYVVFGVFGTSRMFGGFVAGNRLFAQIPMWQSLPDKYPEQMIRRTLLEFDRRMKYNARTVLSMVAIFCVSIALALSSVENSSVPFLVFGAPFIWIAAVLYVYTRIMIRMKSMFVDGYRVEERHIVLPLIYTAIASLIVLVIAGIFARNTSPFHYGIFIRFIENVFGIQRDGDSTIGFPGSPIRVPGSSYVSPAPSARRGGRLLNLRSFAYMFRYVFLGGAIAATIVYIVVSIFRMRSSSRHPAQSFRKSMRRSRSWLRYMLVQATRVWRVFVENFRRVMRLRHKLGVLDISTSKRESRKVADVSAAQRFERNTVLRWHRRLVTWGRSNGIDAPVGVTADEFLVQLNRAYPGLTEEVGVIAGVFDDVFYSRAIVGRAKIRLYVRNIKSITTK